MSGFLAMWHAITMRAHGVVAQAAQEGAARDAERLADAVQARQLGRVEQHFDSFGSGLRVEAHLLLLGDAGYVGDCWWKEPVGNRTGAKKLQGLLRLVLLGVDEAVGIQDLHLGDLVVEMLRKFLGQLG